MTTWSRTPGTGLSSQLATSARIQLSSLHWPDSCQESRRPFKSCPDAMTNWCPLPMQSFFTSDCPTAEWNFCRQATSRGRKSRICMAAS